MTSLITTHSNIQLELDNTKYCTLKKIFTVII